jgi:hypothetical protein
VEKNKKKEKEKTPKEAVPLCWIPEASRSHPLFQRILFTAAATACANDVSALVNSNLPI